MICAEAKGLLESYVKGATDAAAREALEAHFASCEGCRLEAELTRGTHAQRDEGGAGPLMLEPLATEPLPEKHVTPAEARPEAANPAPEPSMPAADADEETSFGDLVLEVPEATSTAAAVAAPPATAKIPSAPAHPASVPVLQGEASNGSDADSAEPKSSATAPAWDFEPADPPRETGPPAGSINLAEQALSRKAEAAAKGKVAALRVVLWAAGGLSGIALLGVSIWIALAFNQPQDEAGPGVSRPGKAPNGSGAEPGAGAIPPSGDSADASSGVPGPEGPPSDGSVEPLPAPPTLPDGSVQSPASGTETGAPSDGRTLRAGSLPATGGGSSGAIVAPPQKTAKPTPAGSASRPPSTGAKSTAATTAPVRTAPSRPVAGSTASGSEAPSAGTSSGASKKPLGPQAPADDLEPVTDESEIPFTTAPKREAPPTPSSAGSTQAGVSVKPAPGSSGSAPAPSAGSEGGAAADPAPAPPAPSKPIDRLHEATVQAAAAEDVEALRKLKISWKSMIRTATAAERARAKREYADCLWALQELSGRTPDRREALAAYREYVLYAPAGANDARTVGRMRFLEDVLAESE